MSVADSHISPEDLCLMVIYCIGDGSPTKLKACQLRESVVAFDLHKAADIFLWSHLFDTLRDTVFETDVEESDRRTGLC